MTASASCLLTERAYDAGIWAAVVTVQEALIELAAVRCQTNGIGRPARTACRYEARTIGKRGNISAVQADP